MSNQYPAQPSYPPQIEKKKKNIPAFIASGFALLFFILLLVSCGSSSTKEVIREVPKEITKEVQVTPDSCIKALNTADSVFETFSDFLDAYGDVPAMNKATENLKALVPIYQDTKADCLASK